MDIEVRCVQIFSIDLGDQLCKSELNQRTQNPRVSCQLLGDTRKKADLAAFETIQEGTWLSRESLQLRDWIPPQVSFDTSQRPVERPVPVISLLGTPHLVADHLEGLVLNVASRTLPQ